MGDNQAVVPEDPAHLEVGWSLLQKDPLLGNHQKGRGQLANGGNLGAGSHAVVRRYEYYKYAGAYDPVTHEALCADGTCNAPSPGELGDAVGAQNAAANVNVPSLTVASTGSGSVSSSDKAITCGNKCFSYYAAGTAVTLTANPSSGSIFSQWTGACSGSQATCLVNVNDQITATATFTPLHTLSIGRSNPGTVIGTPSGLLSTQINCGSNCREVRGGDGCDTYRDPARGQDVLQLERRLLGHGSDLRRNDRQRHFGAGGFRKIGQSE